MLCQEHFQLEDRDRSHHQNKREYLRFRSWNPTKLVSISSFFEEIYAVPPHPDGSVTPPRRGLSYVGKGAGVAFLLSRFKRNASNPATRPPEMTTASQTSPAARTKRGAAPNGDSRPTKTASRTPIPPCVRGKTAANFAKGQAKNQSRNGSVRPHA